MAWDSSRPAPLRRLIREWLIYVGIASVVLVVYYLVQGKKIDIALFAGLLASGPMYLVFGSVLAKFGYQRKTLKDLRQDREMATATRSRGSSSSTAASVARSKPAPTRRTSTGPSQHRKPKRR